jgi:large subunit ribosomal protein L19e
MTLKTIKRLAAEILDVGESKIWMDPQTKDKISEALTRDDVRALIEQGSIRARHTRGVSRFAAREKQAQKNKGRRKGHGSRKGKATARTDPKKTWMSRVRAQRRVLSELVDKGSIEKENAKKIYMRIKGNSFSGKKNLMTYLEENKMLKQKTSE